MVDGGFLSSSIVMRLPLLLDLSLASGLGTGVGRGVTRWGLFLRRGVLSLFHKI